MALFDGVMDRLTGSGPEKIEHANQQTKDEVELVSFVQEKIQEVRGAGSRISFEGIVMTNTAYLLGYDSVVYDTTTKQFRPNNTAARYLTRNRLHVNKILPTVQNRLARLCKSPPKYDVRPNSNDSEDKDAARLGLKVIDMIWDKEKLNQKRIPLYMWMQQAGHSYLKISWDPAIGKQVLDPESGKLIREGDIRIDVVSALEMYPDPLAKSFDEAQWFVQVKVRKLDYFRTHYPDRGSLVKEEGPTVLSVVYEQRINSMNTAGGTGSGVQAQMKNAAIEKAYYERPSEKYPNGRVVVIANGVLLMDKDLPVGEIPFAKFDDVIIGGKYNSESVITHLRPIQDQYNRTINKRAEWVNKLLAGKYLAPKGHGIMAEAINDQSGEIIEYNPVPGAPPPQAMSLPVIPQYAYEEEKQLQEMMYDISGINEISRGSLPSAGMPYAGMAFLQEQDETRVSVVTESNEYSWAQMGKLILMYAEQFYITERLLKLAGKTAEHQVKSFVGADLKGNNDVSVVRGSTVPGSKVLKRQEILNTYQQGLLGDPHDPKVREKVLGLLEYGDSAEMWQDYAVDMAQIKNQLDMIEEGIQPPVSELDNHPMHVQEKNRFRKSDKFSTLNPISQQILLQDIEAHVQALVQLNNPGLNQQLEIAKHMAVQTQGAVNEQTGIQQTQPPPRSPEKPPAF